jgi:hypothetical protein
LQFIGAQRGIRRCPRRGDGADIHSTYLSRHCDSRVDVCIWCQLTVGLDADAYGRIDGGRSC